MQKNFKKTIDRLIDKTADFIGTDPELKSIACIDVALNHAVWLRKELDEAREEIKSLKKEIQIREDYIQGCLT